jgi:anti-repressor protein
MSNERAIAKAFEFEGNQVRIEVIEGEPWFVAKDVAEVLEYSPNSDINSLMSKVPDQWRCPKPFGTSAGIREMLCLSEQGLYFFLARSDKPRALPFQMWISGEVLPSIRKTGRYEMPGAVPPGLPDFNDPIASAEAWLVEAKGRREAEAQVQQLVRYQERSAPFVSFAASVMDSPTTYYVGQVAKAITQGTTKRVGQNVFFAWLREEGFVHKRGPRRNEPTQRSIEQRIMVIVEHVRETEEGAKVIDRTTRITGKGRLYFYGRFFVMAILDGLTPLHEPPDVAYDLDEGDVEVEREAAILVASELAPEDA